MQLLGLADVVKQSLLQASVRPLLRNLALRVPAVRRVVADRDRLLRENEALAGNVSQLLAEQQALRPTPMEPPVTAGAEPAPLCRPAIDERRVVRTLAQLDEIMLELDAAAAISDDDLRRVFQTFRMEFPLDLPGDPFSEEYRAKQFELYEWLHGRPYSAKNEVSPFDVEGAIGKPFPYSTESAQTVGYQLIAIGFLIKHLDLKRGSRVLEFGPGWGNTTIALARMGHAVTAIEIEPNFVRLTEQRAQRKGLKVNAINGDFLDCRDLDGQFDAILFYECFHHCADHRALITALEALVAPGGKVMFAAEPIIEEFPLPWGLRLDGESLWAIRRNGWLELGFKESYFRRLMDDSGWAVRKEVATDTPWGTLYIATRKEQEGAAVPDAIE